jgi:isopropylmalate/homocitrate/citramalate synthase
MTRRIEIVEVGPRDGLQNEPEVVSTADKVALIERALAFGVRRIEAASFVNPKRVPQMADAEAVLEAVAPRAGVTRIGLVLNQRGAERALATNVEELGAVAVASDAFAIRNQGQTSEESVAVARVHEEFHDWLDGLLLAVIRPRLGADTDIDLIADTAHIMFEGLLGSSIPRDRPFGEIVQFLVDVLVAAAPQASRRESLPAKRVAAEGD